MSRDSVDSAVAALWDGGYGVRILGRAGNISLLQIVRIYSDAQRPGPGFDHSAPFVSGIKNNCNQTANPLICLPDVDIDNCTG